VEGRKGQQGRRCQANERAKQPLSQQIQQRDAGSPCQGGKQSHLAFAIAQREPEVEQ
jgi:hypothetical protein